MVITGDIALEDIPASIARPAAEATFMLVGGVTIADPHPYCITPAHMKYLSGGIYLDAEAIRRAEEDGAVCDTCRRERRVPIGHDGHKSSKALSIAVPQNSDLHRVAGLTEYLLAIKEAAEAAGFAGFVFPTR